MKKYIKANQDIATLKSAKQFAKVLIDELFYDCMGNPLIEEVHIDLDDNMIIVEGLDSGSNGLSDTVDDIVDGDRRELDNICQKFGYPVDLVDMDIEYDTEGWGGDTLVAYIKYTD